MLREAPNCGLQALGGASAEGDGEADTAASDGIVGSYEPELLRGLVSVLNHFLLERYESIQWLPRNSTVGHTHVAC